MLLIFFMFSIMYDFFVVSLFYSLQKCLLFSVYASLHMKFLFYSLDHLNELFSNSKLYKNFQCLIFWPYIFFNPLFDMPNKGQNMSIIAYFWMLLDLDLTTRNFSSFMNLKHCVLKALLPVMVHCGPNMSIFELGWGKTTPNVSLF